MSEETVNKLEGKYMHIIENARIQTDDLNVKVKELMHRYMNMYQDESKEVQTLREEQRNLIARIDELLEEEKSLKSTIEGMEAAVEELHKDIQDKDHELKHVKFLLEKILKSIDKFEEDMRIEEHRIETYEERNQN